VVIAPPFTVIRVPRLVFGLSLAIVALSVGAALRSLCWTGDDVPRSFVTATGHEVMLGRGLYRHDSLFIAAGFRGQDLVILRSVLLSCCSRRFVAGGGRP
jgi:hypothetical protein